MICGVGPKTDYPLLPEIAHICTREATCTLPLRNSKDMEVFPPPGMDDKRVEQLSKKYFPVYEDAPRIDTHPEALIELQNAGFPEEAVDNLRKEWERIVHNTAQDRQQHRVTTVVNNIGLELIATLKTCYEQESYAGEKKLDTSPSGSFCCR